MLSSLTQVLGGTAALALIGAVCLIAEKWTR